MKVLDLRCAHGHGFEGWFESEDDFLAQNGRSAIECPLCGDRIIQRLPSAPRLNLGASQPVQAPAQAIDPQAAWLQAVRHLMANTEDVGERFATEARRIHYGEADPRGIRGQASDAERDALRDEGMRVGLISIPAPLQCPVQ